MKTTHRRLWLGLITAAILSGSVAPDATADEPSEEYKQGLRKTLERRRQRRQAGATRADGMIVPYPMPPAVIIRQTSDTHDEIQALLNMLRYGSR
jgi:hypothetical protein